MTNEILKQTTVQIIIRITISRREMRRKISRIVKRVKKQKNAYRMDYPVLNVGVGREMRNYALEKMTMMNDDHDHDYTCILILLRISWMMIIRFKSSFCIHCIQLDKRS
jgi:hypothetical protein